MNRTERTYLKIIKLGIFLCAFIPLVIYSQFLSMFHFPKMIVFRSIVEIMLIFYVLLIIGNRKYRPKWNALLIAITIFTGLYIVASITGVNPYRSFWGTLERMEGVFSFIHYWIFFVILLSIFRNREEWLKLLKLSVIAGFLSILFGYGQYFKLGDFFVGWQHEGRVIGTAGNAALFAGYLIFILFLAIYLLFYKDTSKKDKIFYGLIFVLGIPALFLTAVRGSILSFLGAIFLLGLYLALTSKNPKIKKTSIALIVLLVIIVSIFWFNRNQSWIQENPYLKRITDISLETRTIQTRFAIWKSAWRGWQERFIFGWGPENFNLLSAKYFDPIHYEGFGSEVVWDRAHNAFLNIGATMGIVGLLSYLGILVVLAKYIWKLIKKEQRFIVFAALFLAYIGHNMFIFDTFNSYLLFFITIGYLNFFTKEESETEKIEAVSSVKPRNAILIILVFVVIFTFWKTTIIPAKANFAATRAIVYGRSDEHLSTAFNYFRKSLGYHPIQGEYEIRHHLARMVFRIFSKGDDIQKFGVGEEDVVFAIDEINKNIKTDPLDPIPYLYAARLNEYLSRVEQEKNPEKAGQRLDEADRLLKIAEPLNKKNPYIYFELGQVRIFQGKFEEAIEFFDQGISIRPDVEFGYWYKGVTYLDMGEIEKGKEFIKEAEKRGYVKNISDIHRLLRIYVPLKDYPAIIELYLEAIELEPTNAQFYASLATAYKENGEIDKAIEAALKVGELDPKLKPEADAWIEMLKAEYKL